LQEVKILATCIRSILARLVFQQTSSMLNRKHHRVWFWASIVPGLIGVAVYAGAQSLQQMLAKTSGDRIGAVACQLYLTRR
jgi:hypothetical protein